MRRLYDTVNSPLPVSGAFSAPEVFPPSIIYQRTFYWPFEYCRAESPLVLLFAADGSTRWNKVAIRSHATHDVIGYDLEIPGFLCDRLQRPLTDRQTSSFIYPRRVPLTRWHVRGLYGALTVQTREILSIECPI